MKFVAIIQARMGSSRLPGKILKQLGGKPVLLHVVERVRAAGVFDDVVVATTDRDIDDEVATLPGLKNVTIIRGDEADVLSRFGLAARATDADVITRITADCPLIDPDILREMVDRYKVGDADVVTNARVRWFPRGLDAELFSRNSLNTMLAQAHASSEREHVTPFLYAHPQQFVIVDHFTGANHSDLRLTLDTEEDLDLLQRIFETAENLDQLRLKDVLAILQKNPQWRSINSHIEQKKA